ncbi:MAG TPA: TRAP transporter substrate-binding protein [Burkholderiales bacterium]|nr:TRAP transporter substrate-binding protein [Burkholderiales bacterium]
MTPRELFGLAVLPLLALVFAAPAGAQQTELKFSTFVPPTHGFVVDVLEPLAKEIEKKSGGKVTVRVYAGDSPLGKVENQADQVKQGMVDLAFGLDGIPRGRYLRTSIMEMPFVAENADLASRTLWAMSKGMLAEDWKDFKLVALTCHNPGLFHTRFKPLKTIYDVKGLRMRAPNPPTQELLASLGATPVNMPPGQVYESLRKRLLDGAVFPWDAIKGFRLESMLKYHLDARVYTSCFHLVMNPQRFASYPPEVQEAIDSSIGQPLVDKFGAWWNAWDKAGFAAAMKAGGTLHQVPDATRDKWRAELKPVVDQELVKLEKEGITNAHAIYDEMLKTEARLAGK